MRCNAVQCNSDRTFWVKYVESYVISEDYMHVYICLHSLVQLKASTDALCE